MHCCTYRFHQSIKEQYKESHFIIIKDEISKDKKESSGSTTTPTIVTEAPSKPNQLRGPLQATLLDFVEKKENSDSQVDSVSLMQLKS